MFTWFFGPLFQGGELRIWRVYFWATSLERERKGGVSLVSKSENAKEVLCAERA